MSGKVDLKRPLLTLSGYLIDAEDPELRTLELAQRYFERRVGQPGATEEEICTTLIWLAGARVWLHNAKGAMHTVAHLRARSRGRFKEIETLASILEILLHLEMREIRQGEAKLEALQVESDDARNKVRLKAFVDQLKGRFLSAQGQIEEAMRCFDQAAQELKAGGPAQLEDLAITAEIYNDQAHAYQREGKTEDSLKLYVQAETVSRHIVFPLGLARSLRGRGTLYSDRKEFSEAIKYFKDAVDIYQRHDAPHGILRCSILLGRAYYGIHDLREALFYFEEARLQCGKGRYPNDEAEVNARIGDIMLSEGQYEKAAEYYEQDLQLSQVHGDERTQSHAFRNVGRIQRLLGNFPRAEQCLKMSGQLLTKLGDQGGMVATLQQMVQLYLEQNQTAQARSSLNHLKDRSERLGRNHEKAVCRLFEGIVLRHEGQSTQALPILKDSLFALSREPGFFTVLAQMELAQACFEMNFRDESVSKFNEAIAMARQLKHHDIEKRALDMLSRVDRTEWAKALRSAGGPTAERATTRAILSLVCCELRNTTWLWEQEVERITAMLDGYYEAMAQSISKQRGIVIQIVGSRVIAVFGLEASCDPVQALRCAETCQEAFFKLQGENTQYLNLGMACSIATGHCLHGLMGATDHKGYRIVGEPWELIDRLLDQAVSGEIWACHDTHRGIRHLENNFTPRDVADRGGEGKLVAYTVSSSRQVAKKPAKARG
ncbi:tetratricopeptide repeat protein [bacterium]|nr:tetratricopeptide repeat protein [bacterium]